jgi:hypothetical protein
MKKRHTLLAAAAAIAGLVALPGPAQAVPPQAVPFSFDLQGTNTAGRNGYCSFPVHIEGVSNQKTNPHGKATGFGSATVTNLTTGKKLKFNISGPGTITNFPGGGYTIDGTGHWLLYTTVENSQPAGVLQLAYTTGHVRVTVASDGHTTDYKLNGKSTDVCAALS